MSDGSGGERKLFALDQNFPEPIVEILGDFQEFAELVALRNVDERLTEIDDWELLLALHRHPRPWDGLITTDTSMIGSLSSSRCCCRPG